MSHGDHYELFFPFANSLSKTSMICIQHPVPFVYADGTMKVFYSSGHSTEESSIRGDREAHYNGTVKIDERSNSSEMSDRICLPETLV